MFCLIYGEDDYRSQRKLIEIKRSLGSSEMVEVNTSQFDGEEVTFNQLKAACDVPPFLCSNRLVIVRGLLDRFESPKENKELSERLQKKLENALEKWKALGDYVPTMPDTTLLVFFDKDIDGKGREGKNPLFKIVHLLASKVYVSSPLSIPELKRWIQTRVKESDGAITPRAVDLLVELIGPDLWSLHSEIDKLLCYNAERRITDDDVHQLTSHTKEIKIFDLVDAVIERHTSKAHRLLHRSFQEGMSPVYVLSMVARQFRLVLRAKDLLDQGTPALQIGSSLRLKPYPLKKTVAQAEAYSLPRLKNAYHRILAADVAVKTGKYSDDLAMELLVTELCK